MVGWRVRVGGRLQARATRAPRRGGGSGGGGRCGVRSRKAGQGQARLMRDARCLIAAIRSLARGGPILMPTLPKRRARAASPFRSGAARGVVRERAGRRAQVGCARGGRGGGGGGLPGWAQHMQRLCVRLRRAGDAGRVLAVRGGPTPGSTRWPSVRMAALVPDSSTCCAGALRSTAMGVAAAQGAREADAHTRPWRRSLAPGCTAQPDETVRTATGAPFGGDRARDDGKVRDQDAVRISGAEGISQFVWQFDTGWAGGYTHQPPRSHVSTPGHRSVQASRSSHTTTTLLPVAPRLPLPCSRTSSIPGSQRPQAGFSRLYTLPECCQDVWQRP